MRTHTQTERQTDRVTGANARTQTHTHRCMHTHMHAHAHKHTLVCAAHHSFTCVSADTCRMRCRVLFHQAEPTAGNQYSQSLVSHDSV